MKPTADDLRVAKEIVEAELIDIDAEGPALLVPTAIINRLVDDIASAIASEREKAYQAGFKDGATAVADETIAKLPAVVASIRSEDK